MIICNQNIKLRNYFHVVHYFSEFVVTHTTEQFFLQKKKKKLIYFVNTRNIY